ncbi:hypothetical protein Golob_004148, partial [Gossypium lobatum]|nr:hypothetical protein [Gossypium lobatum]
MDIIEELEADDGEKGINEEVMKIDMKR